MKYTQTRERKLIKTHRERLAFLDSIRHCNVELRYEPRDGDHHMPRHCAEALSDNVDRNICVSVVARGKEDLIENKCDMIEESACADSGAVALAVVERRWRRLGIRAAPDATRCHAVLHQI